MKKKKSITNIDIASEWVVEAFQELNTGEVLGT